MTFSDLLFWVLLIDQAEIDNLDSGDFIELNKYRDDILVMLFLKVLSLGFSSLWQHSLFQNTPPSVDEVFSHMATSNNIYLVIQHNIFQRQLLWCHNLNRVAEAMVQVVVRA